MKIREYLVAQINSFSWKSFTTGTFLMCGTLILAMIFSLKIIDFQRKETEFQINLLRSQIGLLQYKIGHLEDRLRQQTHIVFQPMPYQQIPIAMKPTKPTAASAKLPAPGAKKKGAD